MNPINQDLSHYDAVIADLEARRDQLNIMIDGLRQLRSSSMGVPGPPPPSSNAGSRPATSDSDIPHDAFFQMTIPDAAKKYLGMVKHTRTLQSIGDALLAGGLKTASANFRETVRAILSRNPEFVKVNGEWGLSEWYPAMRRDRKRQARGTSEMPNDRTVGDLEEDNVDEKVIPLLSAANS